MPDRVPVSLMMTEKTSWRNLKGGLPSNFSVRGGFFTNGPRLSWVAFITAASTAMFQVLQSRRGCHHLRNTRNVWGTEVFWLSPWYTSKNTYILFHTSYISFHLDLSQRAYSQVHFSYSALFFSPVPSMRQIVTDRPSTLWYILLPRSRRSLQNWPQRGRGQCSLGGVVRSTTSGWTQLARAPLRNLTLESSAGGCHLVTWPLARLARRLQGRTSPLPWGSLSLLWRAPVLTKPPGCVAVVVQVGRRRKQDFENLLKTLTSSWEVKRVKTQVTSCLLDPPLLFTIMAKL